MERLFLVAAQLSSLFPTNVASVLVQTTQQGIPLPPARLESDPPDEHAISSSVLHTPTTGTILLRVLHRGLIIELVSLSTSVAPIRLVFPAFVLPCPAIFFQVEGNTTELQVVAITNIGSLYTIPIPIRGRMLWQDQTTNIWPQEYIMRSLPAEWDSNPVHAHTPQCVLIGLPGGKLLRLESCYGGTQDTWTEHVIQPGSIMYSLASAFQFGQTKLSDIISIATHPFPTDIDDVWSLSRDSTLRLWSARTCKASKQLGCTLRNVPVRGHDASTPGNSNVLLDPEPQTLLRVVKTHSIDSSQIYVLAFIPTSSSSTSGGIFWLVKTEGDKIYDVTGFEASQTTARCNLRDFTVIGNTLYTLWDRQGCSMIERTDFKVNDLGDWVVIWRTSAFAHAPELTPSYMEEKLLSPGSLTEKFCGAILRPGVFSPLTLRTAIDQYIESCLSLPGAKPAQLTAAYSTIGETIAAVVGCTVTLNRDPHTGASLHEQYWIALKRDWEGFVARCREIERSGRWPLVLGAQGPDELIVVERERIGALVIEDVPITIQTMISHGHIIDAQYSLLVVLWLLRGKLGPQVIFSIEKSVSEILHQEIAFSFTDILCDQARHGQYVEKLGQDSVDWLVGCLGEINDLDAAVRVAIDAIGGFDTDVKREEEEIELMLPARSQWAYSLAAAYAASSIEARYELALSLITVLFFIPDELPEWDPSLLVEIFAVYRGIAMLRFIAHQPTGEISPTHSTSATSDSPDDVISRMRNMNVSSSRTRVIPRFSLVHLLATQSGVAFGIPSAAAHRFLDGTGLLRSVSLAQTTKHEVMFCENLRRLNFFFVARELLSWLPRTPGATFVLALTYLNIGRYDDASLLFDKLAGRFAYIGSMTPEEQLALAPVLPGGALFDSEFSFYLYALESFKLVNRMDYEVEFSKLAISVAPPVADTTPLWNAVIRGYCELGQYDDAYAALMSTPHEAQKREMASQLAIRMCEEGVIERLMSYDFIGIAEEVEGALSFKARNDPRLLPNYSRILYTWYIHRVDYRSASLTMYQRARKLQEIVKDVPSFSKFAQEQLESLLIAINALSLVDPKVAWVVLSISSRADLEQSHKRQKLAKHIPESKFTVGTHDTEIVHLSDMQYDFTLLSAQLDATRRDPSLLVSPEFLLPPSLLVMRLAQANRFNTAMTTARSLKVDMTDVFTHLTHQCLRLSRNPDIFLQDDSADWLLTDKVSSWAGTLTEKAWRYLRQSLERHDSIDTEYRYAKCTLETIWSVNRSSHPPPWLIHTLENYQPEYLIRISMKYENLEGAVDYTLALIKNSDAKLARDSSKTASMTWLPYTLIDQVLTAAGAQDKSPARLSALRIEVTNRIKRMQNRSQAMR